MTFALMSLATGTRNAIAAICRLAACAVALSAMPLAWAADAQPKPQSPAANKQQREDRAKGLALGQETAQRVSETQLRIADRVLTGDAACEFNQTVSVLPVAGQPGHFHVTFKRVVYVVIPEETTSGAIRLEDKKAGHRVAADSFEVDADERTHRPAHGRRLHACRAARRDVRRSGRCTGGGAASLSRRIASRAARCSSASSVTNARASARLLCIRCSILDTTVRTSFRRALV